jgi:Domain of unknown function (DUF3471)
MTTAGTLNNGRPSGSSYGLMVSSQGGRRRVSLTGTWAGSGADFLYYPDQKFGTVVLANWDYTPIEGFTSGIADIFLPAPAPAPAAKPVPTAKAPSAVRKPVKVSPKTLEAYDGEYRLGPSQVLTVSHAGSQLYLGPPGQKFALTSLSDTEFSLDVAQARVTFERDKSGEITQFVWKQGGTETVAPKIALIKPTPQELQEFAGTYANDELDVRFGVELRGPGLVLVMPGQPEVRLSPDERDHFAGSSRVVPMIVFQRDAQNRVTGFIIDRDSVKELLFKKI